MDADGHQVHTAAVFVTVDGAPVRASVEDAEFYVDWMDELLTRTSPGGEWNRFFPTDLAGAQARYRAARDIFQQIAVEAGGGDSPPTVIAATPADGATSVSTGTAVTVTFSEPMDPTTIDGTTFTLRDASNQSVQAAVTYSGTANRATLTPTNPLADSTTYTASVRWWSRGRHRCQRAILWRRITRGRSLPRGRCPRTASRASSLRSPAERIRAPAGPAPRSPSAGRSAAR